VGDGRIELLQGMSIFGGVKADVLERLLERAVPREVARGEAFFREGDAGRSGFVLERGRVGIVKSFQGQEYLLRTLGRGDCFGEVAMMDFFPRSAAVIALEDCRALEFLGRDLLGVVGGDFEQHSLIYMNVARELARRLRGANEALFRARVRYEDVAEGYAFTTT
jgi:CRP-like cAMP-binding protein